MNELMDCDVHVSKYVHVCVCVCVCVCVMRSISAPCGDCYWYFCQHKTQLKEHQMCMQ